MATTENPGLVLPLRKASEWASPRGLRMDIVPWRLYDKAKQMMWDPADIDYSQDVEDWKNMTRAQQAAVSGLARGFMVGEESVTLDIVPLMIALGDEGRTEEVIYLTTFAFEEAKHVDFFHRWFKAVGVDIDEMDRLADENARERGRPVPDPHRTEGMFESELPRVMRRVLHDPSPQAILDCSVTYNQFVEGCLAISGYKVWGEMFEAFGVLPGLRQGLRYVRQDEGRHITYGTYLARRLLAAHPELLDYAKQRMYDLRDFYYRVNPLPEEGDVDAEAAQITHFRGYVENQVEARITVMERAAALSEAEAESDRIAEEVEAELSGAGAV